MHGEGTGGVTNLREGNAADLVYEGTVTLRSGTGAGLFFRATDDSEHGYGAVLDANAGMLQLCRDFPGWYIAMYQMTVEHGRPYRIKAVASGTTFEVYLDGVKRITVSNDLYASGKLGVVLSGVADWDDLIAYSLP